MANTTKRGSRATPAEDRYRRLLAGKDEKDLKALAAAEGVRSKTLSWWRWEIERRDQVRREEEQRRARPKRAPGKGPAFLPVRVAGSAPSSSGSVPGGAFTVLLHGGREVSVPPAFDATELRRLVSVLEELPC